MKRARRGGGNRLAIWMFGLSALCAGLGAALAFGAGASGAGFFARPEAASLLGFACGVGAVLAAWLMRLLFARPVEPHAQDGEARDAVDRA